jgi:predicted restriction endonuclease
MLNNIINKIDQIKVHKHNGQYAVYKPLLLLMVFNDVLNGKPNEFRFNDIYPRLQNLMEKYGWLTISKKKAEYPFYFLASSVLWKTNIDRNQLNHPDAPTKKELENAIGKLEDEVYRFLLNDPAATKCLIDYISNKYFSTIVDIN